MGFLNKNIISFDNRIFGFDLNETSLKVLQLEKDGKFYKVKSYGVSEIPKGYIEDGKIINKGEVITIIRETIRKAKPKKINTRKVICSIPESKAFLRLISVPRMNENEIHEAIKWEMEANIPLPIDKVYFDYQVLDKESSNHLDVLTVSVAREIVDDLIDVLTKADLEVYGIEVEVIATSRSLIKEVAENNIPISLIVDLGNLKTCLILVEGGIPYFTSSVPFSSANINDAVSKSLNINSKQAEEAKINYGIEHVFEDNPIYNSTKYLLENLVVEINKTIDFFEETSKKGKKIEKIILCGGGANLRGLKSYLSKKINREVEQGDPWVNLNFGKKIPIIDKEKSLRFATAIGLAMRGISYKEYEN